MASLLFNKKPYDTLCLALPESKLNQTELREWQEFLDELFSLSFGAKKEVIAIDTIQLIAQAKKWLGLLEKR